MKRKRRLKKKTIIIIIIILLIIITSIVFIKKSKSTIIFKKNNKIEINTKVYNLDCVKKVNKAKIVTKKKKIDTSKLGKKTITIKVKTSLGKVKKYNYKVNIVDTKKPTIKYQEKITVTVGDNIDLLEGVTVKDNSKEDIKPIIDGKYDLNKVGTYKLYYIATDKSGNKAKSKFILEIIDKETSKHSNNISKTSNGHSITVKDGITYIDGILIANKTYSLPSTYNPGGITDEVMSAFNKMAADAKSVGLNIFIASGFRSYDIQTTLYNNYVARDGKTEADTYSARPGHSEHQSGLAFDLNLVDESFENTNEGKWLNSNAYRFGFILRYPKGKTNETGYIYESWHYRYVGEELATKLYNNGDWITLEKYFGITSEYNY